MGDFLKANPAFSAEDYLWKLSAPFIQILSADQTHIVYLSEKEAKLREAKKKSINFDDMIDDEDFIADTGVPVFD